MALGKFVIEKYVILILISYNYIAVISIEMINKWFSFQIKSY